MIVNANEDGGFTLETGAGLPDKKVEKRRASAAIFLNKLSTELPWTQQDDDSTSEQ